MGYMVASAFLFAVMAAFTRLAGERLPTQEIVFFRGLLGVAIGLAVARRAGASIAGRRPLLLAARGLTGFAALSCYFWTVVHMPFAHAVLLAQTNPVFTALCARLFLGERPGRRFLPAFGLVAAGVAVLVPHAPAAGATGMAPAGVAVALAGAALAGSAYAEVRALSRTEHPLTIVLWFQAACALLSLPGMAWAGFVVPRGADLAWLAGVGVTAAAGQYCLTEGLRRLPAGRATLANPLVVVFGAALGALLFREPLGWNVLAGGALLAAGLSLAGLGRPRPGVAATADA